MKSFIGGILLAMVMIGVGAHMTIAPAQYNNTKESDTSGRRAAFKKLFAVAVETIGARPMGLILVVGGAAVGFATLRSKSSQPVQPADA